MNKRFFSIVVLLIIAAHSLHSQSITNVQARVEGNTVVVNYQLQHHSQVEISLYVSEDGGCTFAGPIKCVRGDVGKGIPQGSKQIVWDVLSEKEFLHCSNMVFRVKSVSLFLDPRDGKTYKTVKIGKQVWLAENLAYKPSSGNYWAYDNNSSNVVKFGYMYDWQTAKNACPTGWHLPSDAEWTQLIDFVESNADKLKARSGWYNDGNGTDDYGFSAFPAGERSFNSGNFFVMGINGYWWSSSESGTANAWVRYIDSFFKDVGRSEYYDKRNGCSVRCLRDS